MKKYSLITLAAAMTSAVTLCAAPAETGKPVNHAKFGTFEKTIKNDRPVAYSFWRPNTSKCTALVEKGVGIDNSSAVVLKSGSGSLIYYVGVKPGAKITAKVKARKSGKVAASISIRYQKAGHKWILTTDSKKAAFTKDDEWTTVEVKGIAPEDAAYIAVMLGANTFDDANAKVIFDNQEIYID